MQISRRSMLSLPISFGAVSLPSSVLGANDRVNVAVVGVGGRGRAHIDLLARQVNCRIAAVCDIDQAARERAVAQVEQVQGRRPKTFTEMRRLFEDEDLDAVSFATPNHWHALGTIWACQAGKDVYVEKPACHNVWEGKQMIDAARKYRRIVQVGSQSRSTALKIRAMELLQQGAVGRIYMAKGLCYKWRPSIGRTPDIPVPPGIDWDGFLGPAPMRPFSQNRFKYNWHWFWDTGNGDIGNQGVHEVDICLWGLGDIGLPRAVVSTGRKYVYDDDQETPNTQSATFDYGDRQIVFEVRGLPTGTESDVVPQGGNTVGNVFYGSEGYMAVDGVGFRVFKGRNRQKVLEENTRSPQEGYDAAAHFANFLKAVRSRNPKNVTASLEIGVKAATLCHLANISYRLGRGLAFDPDRKIFPGDAEADRLLTRPYRAPYVVPSMV